MKLHKEAFPPLFFAVVVFILFNLGMWRMFDDFPQIYKLIFFISLILLSLVFYFFRVPYSVESIDESIIISPAHGKVVEIVEEVPQHYYTDTRRRISIFMSPLDIHCNYSPIKGKVVSMDYFPGKYLMAFHPKSSILNEHTFTVIENNGIAIGVKQIAGFMARRIVPYLQTGMSVNQNDELGFIKFGSRVDLYLPLDIDVEVKVGQKVKGGITKIASLPA